MQPFVLTGKAKTVFRLIELKAREETLARMGKGRNYFHERNIKSNEKILHTPPYASGADTRP